MIHDPLWQFLALLGVHWVGDFFLQSHWMSMNKSKRWDALAMHIGVYSGTLAVGTAVIFGTQLAIGFAALNGSLHWITDFWTSRATAALWKRERVHDFFVVIGADQLTHQVTLAVTMWLIFVWR